MKIRITLERRAYWGSWTGMHIPAQTIVREFDDEYAAAEWFVNESYFAEQYTKRATWERVDE